MQKYPWSRCGGRRRHSNLVLTVGAVIGVPGPSLMRKQRSPSSQVFLPQSLAGAGAAAVLDSAAWRGGNAVVAPVIAPLVCRAAGEGSRGGGLGATALMSLACGTGAVVSLGPS